MTMPRPSTSCLDALHETWDPTLDPLAITREVPRPDRLTPACLTLLLTGLAAGVGMTLPCIQALGPSKTSPPNTLARTISLALGDEAHLPGPSAPGGGKGEPQSSPISAPGPGGLGLVDAVPSLPSFSPSGDLVSPVLLPGPTLALGGGSSPSNDMAGGTPDGGRGPGSGGGARGRSVAGSRMGSQAGGEVATRIPALEVQYRYRPLMRTPPGFNQSTMFVTLRVLVAMDGTVARAEVVQGEAILHENAIAAVKKWRFKPLAACGFTTPQTTTITLHYSEEHP